MAGGLPEWGTGHRNRDTMAEWVETRTTAAGVAVPVKRGKRVKIPCGRGMADLAFPMPSQEPGVTMGAGEAADREMDMVRLGLAAGEAAGPEHPIAQGPAMALPIRAAAVAGGGYHSSTTAVLGGTGGSGIVVVRYCAQLFDISGRVTDSHTGEGVDGVTVEFSEGGGSVVTAGAGGTPISCRRAGAGRSPRLIHVESFSRIAGPARILRKVRWT